MIHDKMLLALILVTAFTLGGMVIGPFFGLPPLGRYFAAIFGEFLIIFVAVLIGFGGVKLFTFRSALGKSIAFISAGMLSWGIGNLFWLYYNVVLQIEIPYPSLADAGYVGMIPIASIGLYWLLKNIKMKFDHKTIFKMTILPVIVFLFTYWLFIQTKLAEEVPLLEKTLNVIYPMGDIVFLSFGLVILSLVRGGKLFKPVAIICMGFIIEAMADFSFSYTTATETYYTGCWVDILFALAFFTIGVGIYYTKGMMANIPDIWKGPKKA